MATKVAQSVTVHTEEERVECAGGKKRETDSLVETRKLQQNTLITHRNGRLENILILKRGVLT